MISYNKKIGIKQLRSGVWVIESDRGQRYETMMLENSSTPITKWWDMNHHSDLREWQKDILVKGFWDALGTLDLFVIFKKGAGYNQPHDMCLARFKDIWIFSTTDDTWIVKNPDSEFWLEKSTSLGSILDPEVRGTIYAITDEITYA